MPLPFALIPFAVFFGCVLAQFYFLRQVRRVLATRHPDVWRELSEKAWFIDNAVVRFVWKKRDRQLNDPSLTVITGRMRKLQFVTIAAWVAYGVCLFALGFGGRPPNS